jgi:hypothetical protein
VGTNAHVSASFHCPRGSKENGCIYSFLEKLILLSGKNCKAKIIGAMPDNTPPFFSLEIVLEVFT